MKKLIFVLTAFVLLTGCTRTFEPQPVYPEVPVTTIHPSETAIGEPEPADPFAMQEIGVTLTAYDAHVSRLDNSDEDKHRVFRSADELTEFVESVIAPNYPSGVPEKFYDYDEKFFEENILYYTAAVYPTCSAEVLTADATAFMQYGAVTIDVPVKIPEVHLDAMAYICFFAELDKNRVGDITENLVIFNTVNSDCEIITEVIWYHAPDGQVNDYCSHYLVYGEGESRFLTISYSALNDTVREERRFEISDEHISQIKDRLAYLITDRQPDGRVIESNEGDYFYLSGNVNNRRFSFDCNNKDVPAEFADIVAVLETIALDSKQVHHSFTDGNVSGTGKNYSAEETTSVPEREAE